jgi:hypothetical protein
MPEFLLGDRTQVFVAELVYPSRTKPAIANFHKLLGGTQAGVQLGENNVNTKEFDTALWEDGIIAALSWTIPIQSNWRDTDPAYLVIESTALAGAECYVEFRPLGTGAGRKKFEGVASIQGFQIESPADNIITNGFTFLGRGPLTPGVQT